MPKEIERRLLVLKLSPDFHSFFNSPKVNIWQGYLGGLVKGTSLRLRIYDDVEAELTLKEGKGEVRDEDDPCPVPIKFARRWENSCLSYLEKGRYKNIDSKWELNFFKPPLDGIVIAEIELDYTGQKFQVPDCIEDWLDVTEILTNHQLANITAELRDSGEPALPYVFKHIVLPIPLIVLVGGPGSGKSGIMKLLQARPDLHCVPEVASIVIGQVNIKPDKYPNKHFQKLIYDVSSLFEVRAAHYATMHGKLGVVLDRAKRDGAGYFDGGIEEYERVVNANIEDDQDRYKIVICLDVPPEDIYEKVRVNNPNRPEDYQQARKRADKVLEVWQNHPNFVFIGNDGGWDEKVNKVMKAIDKVLKNGR